MTLIANVFPNYEIRGQINIKKVPPQSTLGQETWLTRPNNFEIGTVARLSYFLITLNAVKFEKVTLSHIQSLKTVWQYIKCLSQVFCS